MRTVRVAAMAVIWGLVGGGSPSLAAERAGHNLAPKRLAHVGRWLVDPQGRVVMIRGGNVIELVGDGPQAEHGVWNPDTPRRLAQAGFNGVRLAVFMSRLAPEPGRIDKAYLDAVAATIAAYRANGIITLLDFHQDEYGPDVGVRGMPGWMTLAGGLQPDRTLKFPNGYFRDRAVQAAFDNFWADRPVSTGEGVQEAYIEIVAEAATRFADDPAVFGIDLMNEPATGTPCSLPDPRWTGCAELETKDLAPFYTKAGRAVSAVAPNTILFVEPFMLQGAMGVPIDTPMPGIDQRGLSYHDYGPFRPVRERVSAAALAVASTKSAAILNTEWSNSNDPDEITGQAGDFDAHLVPWLAWARGRFEALVDAGASGPSRPDEPKDRELVLRAYARPYPAATAGTPLAFSFDADAGVLRYRWSPRGPDGLDRSRLPTEIRMPAPSFPSGYRVVARGGRVVSRPNAPMLVVRAARPDHDVEVNVWRVGDLPRLTHASGARGSDERFSLDSNLGDLLRDPAAKAVLGKYLPTLTASDQIALAPQTTLRSMQPYLPEMTDDVAKKIDAELAALPRRSRPSPAK